ncbi:MAG: hypothetical protein ACYC63_20045 [Armatimonadota bacterium]
MRTIGGVLLGLLLFFPGVILLKWLSVSVLGVYGALTVTDGCLVMIIILLCVILVRGGVSPAPAKAAARTRRTTRTVEQYPGDPQLEFLPGEEPRRRRQPTGRRRTGTAKRER